MQKEKRARSRVWKCESTSANAVLIPPRTQIPAQPQRSAECIFPVMARGASNHCHCGHSTAARTVRRHHRRSIGGARRYGDLARYRVQPLLARRLEFNARGNYIRWKADSLTRLALTLNGAPAALTRARKQASKQASRGEQQSQCGSDLCAHERKRLFHLFRNGPLAECRSLHCCDNLCDFISFRHFFLLLLRGLFSCLMTNFAFITSKIAQRKYPYENFECLHFIAHVEVIVPFVLIHCYE